MKVLGSVTVLAACIMLTACFATPPQTVAAPSSSASSTHSEATPSPTTASTPPSSGTPTPLTPQADTPSQFTPTQLGVLCAGAVAGYASTPNPNVTAVNVDQTTTEQTVKGRWLVEVPITMVNPRGQDWQYTCIIGGTPAAPDVTGYITSGVKISEQERQALINEQPLGGE